MRPLTGAFRRRLLASAFPNFLQNGGSRVAGENGDSYHPPSCGFHLFTTHDFVGGPVIPFYQYVWQELPDDLVWRLFFKNHDGVDALKRRKNFRALLLANHWAAGTFQLLRTLVAVEPDDQNVSLRSCEFELPQMAGMQEVETAVGEHHAAPIAFLVAKPQNRFL